VAEELGENWHTQNTTTKWQFTSYERDVETDPGNGKGNDYTMARYNSDRFGRFSSADPLARSPADGSVVVGNYAVDPYTRDVFSATIGCYEEKNKRLEALQAQVRAKLHLSQSEYQRLKTIKHGFELERK